jgi:hypothetical protein
VECEVHSGGRCRIRDGLGGSIPEERGGEAVGDFAAAKVEGDVPLGAVVDIAVGVEGVGGGRVVEVDTNGERSGYVGLAPVGDKDGGLSGDGCGCAEDEAVAPAFCWGGGGPGNNEVLLGEVLLGDEARTWGGLVEGARDEQERDQGE